MKNWKLQGIQKEYGYNNVVLKYIRYVICCPIENFKEDFMENKVQYSKPIAAAIEKFLKENGLRPLFYEEDAVFKFEFRVTESRISLIQYHIYVKPDCFVVYGFSPFAMVRKPGQAGKLKEFISFVNQGLYRGAFETDDKMLAFRTFTDCSGDMVPNDEILRNAVYWPLGMFQKYADDIADILQNDVPVETVLVRLKKGNGIRKFLAGRDFDPSKNLPEIYAGFLK